MAKIGAVIDRISWPVAIMMALLLGLAPFAPEPHVWQKLKMLMAGDLTKPIDIFDFLMHATPWLILTIKVARRFGPEKPSG